MKTLIIAIFVVVAVYSLGIYMSVTLDNYLDAADKILGEIEEATKEENWETVREQLDNLTAMWPNKHTILAYFIDHNELDRIEFGISRIEGENILNDKSLLYPEIVSLRKIIEQVRGKYSFKLCNIF